MNKFLRYLILTLAGFVCSQGQCDDNRIVSVYAYHLKPPLIIDPLQESGLYYDYSLLLSELSGTDFFTLFIPRKRLDKLLSDGDLDGVVLGANPVWFKDSKREKYFWTDSIMTDRDEFVSGPDFKFEYKDFRSLDGHSFAGVRGYFYAKLALGAEQSTFTRFDTIGEKEVLDMVIKGRTDIGIVSRSTLEYMRAMNPSLYDPLYLSDIPHEQFSRFVMVPLHMEGIHKKIEATMATEEFKTRWAKTLARYNIIVEF